MVRLAPSDEDESILVRNLKQAYIVSDMFAQARGLDLWDVRDVMTTMLVTESGGGFIYANDGQGFREPNTVADRTPWNWNDQTNRPIGTPESRAKMRAILRVSLTYPHDKVGSNGRSTGPAQQLSEETGGGWGPMRETMIMANSMTLFVSNVNWKNRDQWYPSESSLDRKLMANWQTAMLLRTQRPLASEIAVNYGGQQLARSQAIARDPRFAPETDTEKDWSDMATKEEMQAAFREAVKPLAERLEQLDPLIRDIYNRTDWTNTNVDGVKERLKNLDPVIRETFNRADWTNDRTKDILKNLPKLPEDGV